MGKKIVLLTGSPRRGGNTAAMADGFEKRAKELGHEVVRFDTAFMKIGGCHACETCYKTGKPCSFDDDFNRIAVQTETADAVVFVMPVYWYTMPAQIKAVLDRFFCFMVAQKPIAGKKTALISCCEEEDMTVLDGVNIPFERSVALMQWEVFGEVLVPGVYAKGDIDRTDGVARAAALAEKL